MNSDSIFLKGSTHLVCQDFAMNSTYKEDSNEYSEIMVADGCSTFKDGDNVVPNNFACFAARAACLSASTALANSDDPLRCIASRMFLDAIHSNIQDICKSIIIRPSKLATTLLTTVVVDDLVLTLCIGDGIIVHEYEKEYMVHERSYTPNAPMNITYLDEDAHARYDEHDIKAQSKLYVIYKNDLKTELRHNFFIDNYIHSTQNLIIKPVNKLKSVTLFSDGISSFNKIKTNDAIINFLSFKNRKGTFVKRRVLSQMEEFKKQGITHSDDFSMATINFGE